MTAGRLATFALLSLVACGNVRTEDPFGGGETGASGPGSTMPSNSDPTATGGASEDGSSGDVDDDVLFDLPVGDVPNTPGDADFSYIWIANSAQGTVSKIDTRTATELARYRTRPDPPVGDITYALRGPSRTSVNLAGDVIVVNRDEYGAVKIAARPEHCVDADGNGVVTTSSGPGDILPWGEDECVLWDATLPVGSRPAAWTSGEMVADGNDYINLRVWTAAPDPNVQGGGIIYLLDGDDGAILDEVRLTPGECNCGTFGPYGGAVDGDNTFWTFGQNAQTLGDGPLIRVDYDDESIPGYMVIPFPAGATPGYGIMVDSEGRPWLAGFNNDLFRYNPGAGTWTEVDMSGLAAPFSGTNPTLRGIQQDANGDIWVALAYGYPTLLGATDHGVLRVDADSASVIEVIDSSVLTGLSMPAGISIDFEGYVWVVDTLANAAWKVDPSDYSFEKVAGLVNPYTYSDMTGHGLQNAGTPEG